MAFPVISTVKNCFTRIPREWDIIWRYLQVPFLLSCLFACVMLGVYVLAGPETFIKTQVTKDEEQLAFTILGWVYFAATAYVPLLFFVPFVITWSRYTLVDARGLDGRASWSWGQAEWAFLKGAIIYLFVIIGWGLVFGVATLILFVPAVLGVSVMELDAQTLQGLTILGWAIYAVAVAYFMTLIVRLNVVFIPLSFGAPFTSDGLWALTRGKVLRFVGGAILIGLFIAVPTLVLDAFLNRLFFNDDPSGVLKSQLLNSMGLLPITALSIAVTTAYYAEVWRYSGGHEAWSGTDAPVAPPEPNSIPAS